MSFWKWLSEQFTPGPVGSIRPNSSEEETKTYSTLAELITVLIIGSAFLALFIWMIVESDDWKGNTIILIIYLGLSFLLSPKPRYDNLGWFGGLINNPFRISDNINRFILLLSILLMPGQFIVFGFKALIILLASSKSDR